MSELRKIPNVGKATEADLIARIKTTGKEKKSEK